jgi:hypothetical protein
LGEIETPFFGAPKKEKREKRRRNAPFFADGGFVGGGVVSRARLAEFWGEDGG